MRTEFPSQLCEFTCYSALTKGESVYRSGELANGFFYVESGLIGLYKTSINGKENLLRVYDSGCFFGYRTLFSHQHYYATTRAMLPSRIATVRVNNVAKLQAVTPSLVDKLLLGVCQELGEAESRLANVASHKAGTRILDAVLYLFREFPEYPWTNREIGEFSGTETETVIRFCRKLKSEGLFEPVNRRLKPVSLNALQDYRNKLVSMR
ncbi:Crp/Fnr family transcriptional regulator [Photobacterium sagamiensis]|uniref:Crp/Fnr family transcriptional regulator n=1 Tax=Photobacterium sagamiensis TaxID=2910241 RepID=UPI003D11971E